MKYIWPQLIAALEERNARISEGLAAAQRGQKDLEEALENKSIFGAGLDVTSQEPLALESQLMSYENVILTPHSLCWTDECFHNIASEAIESIINFFDQKPIINQVNR